MTHTIRISPLLPGQEDQAARLVEDTFQAHVAPLFTQQGRDEFMQYVGPTRIRERLDRGGHAAAAWDGDDMIGYIEVRSGTHICQFFVKSSRRRSGTGKKLLAAMIGDCRNRVPDCDRITVNASPNAVPAYERMGFTATEEEQEMNGIRFLPMQLLVK